MIHLPHDKEVLSHRSDRCTMESHRTSRSTRQTGRPTARAQHARYSRRHVLHRSDWLCLANVATRLSALANSLRILRPMARRRNLGTDERALARTSSQAVRSTRGTIDCGSRQPICEDDRSRRRMRPRRRFCMTSSTTATSTRMTWSRPRVRA